MDSIPSGQSVWPGCCQRWFTRPGLDGLGRGLDWISSFALFLLQRPIIRVFCAGVFAATLFPWMVLIDEREDGEQGSPLGCVASGFEFPGITRIPRDRRWPELQLNPGLGPVVSMG